VLAGDVCKLSIVIRDGRYLLPEDSHYYGQVKCSVAASGLAMLESAKWQKRHSATEDTGKILPSQNKEDTTLTLRILMPG
jgi:hypothetical protein